MKTIGAKELRLHLDEIFDRVLNGEDVIVSHRFKEPIRLSAVSSDHSDSRGKLAGLRAFDAALKRKPLFDPAKSVKELYDESISKKHLG